MLKSEVRSLIRDLIDDPDGERWGDANLDMLTEMNYNRLWSEVLKIRSSFLVQTDKVAAANITSPGKLDMSTVSEGGELSQSIYQVIKVQRDGQGYNRTSENFVIMDEVTGVVTRAPDYSWLQREEFLWMFPLDTSTDVHITYSYYPTDYTDLLDTAIVPWVNRHEDALVWATASQAMAKGGAEDNKTHYLISRDARDAMLKAVQNFQAGPVVISQELSDDPLAWSSIE